MNVISFLEEKGEVTYIDLIEPLREGTAEVLIASEEGVLIRINKDTLCGVLFDERALPLFAKLFTDCTSPIAVHGGPLVEYLKTTGIPYHLSCVQAVYTRKQLLFPSSDFLIQPLVMEDLPIVLANYNNADEEYLTERVASGCMKKVVIDGRLAAFIGRHREGTIGMLEVLPAYRRRHIAEELEKAYINMLLQEGRTPYCHVVLGNEASMALQKKLGLSFGKDTIHWFN